MVARSAASLQSRAEGICARKQLKELSARGSRDRLRAAALAAHPAPGQPGLPCSRQHERARVKHFAVSSPSLYQEKKMLCFKAWDIVSRGKKKRFGPGDQTTWRPGAGQEAGCPWQRGHPSLGGGDQAIQMSSQPSRFQHPHHRCEPPQACGLNSAISNA